MNNKVLNCDCMEYMATLPDKAFDLAIVDPPYGIGCGSMNMGSANSSKIKSSNWDIKIPDEKYFDELFRVSKNQIIWGANYFKLPGTKTVIIWDKAESMYGRSFSEAEISFGYGFNINTKILKLDSTRTQDKKIHKAQKPVALYKWLLVNYAKPGQTIFDSHVGSGSSRIACYDMGFDFTGCELDPDYWKAQEERFKNHISQQSLFDTGEIQDLIYNG